MQVGPDFVFHVIGSNHIPDSIRRLNGTMIDDVVRIVIHGFGERLYTLHSLNTLSLPFSHIFSGSSKQPKK
jgi:hypothetical protein